MKFYSDVDNANAYARGRADAFEEVLKAVKAYRKEIRSWGADKVLMNITGAWLRLLRRRMATGAASASKGEK